jgi:hypothetical protein
MPAAPPALNVALLDLLEAKFEEMEEAVRVSYGRPGTLPDEYRLVYLLSPANWVLRASEQHRIETFDFRLAIECYGPGEEAAAVTDAARWDIVWAVHEVMKAEDALGYETKGLPLTMTASSLTLYEKGWVAYSEVSVGMQRRVN